MARTTMPPRRPGGAATTTKAAAAAAPREQESRGPWIVAAVAVGAAVLAVVLRPRAAAAAPAPLPPPTQRPLVSRTPRPADVPPYQPGPFNASDATTYPGGQQQALRVDGRTGYRQVATMQWQLNEMSQSFNSGPVDGVWGSQTRAGVRAFLASRGAQAAAAFDAAGSNSPAQVALAVNAVDAAYREAFPPAPGPSAAVLF